MPNKGYKIDFFLYKYHKRLQQHFKLNMNTTSIAIETNAGNYNWDILSKNSIAIDTTWDTLSKNSIAIDTTWDTLNHFAIQ